MTQELQFTVPDGVASTNVYVVKYDEDLWYKLSEDTRDYCITRWISIAKPLDVSEVVLILMPDPIFPSRGKEKPYIEWRHRFPKDNGGEWVSSCRVTLNTNDHRDRLDEEGQEQMWSYFGTYPKGSKFTVKNLDNKILWEHTT